MIKKILLLTALFSTLSSAHADWSKIEHSDKQATLYVDFETRADSGRGTIVMWHLVDYAAPQDLGGKPFRSAKGQYEYDCAKDLSRELMYFWHPDPMGNSQMVNAAYVPTAWITPIAGSTERALMQLVCKPK
jgi:hypothetical protein